MKILKNYFYLFLLVLIITNISCNKNEINIVKTYYSSENEFKIISKTQDSVVINYKVKSNGLKETGIIYSKDSLILNLYNSTINKILSIFNSKDSTYTCYIGKLEYNSKYWVKIYFKNLMDTVTYSKVYSFITNGININLITSSRTSRGQYVAVSSDITDTIKSNFKMSINEIDCEFKFDYYLSEKMYYIYIPQSLTIGIHKLSIYYKNIVVFQDSLEVLEEAIFTQITKHPDGYGCSNSFIYNNEIYILYGYNYYESFWKWNPQSNIWTKLSDPAIIYNLPMGESGYEVNGKIYFPPFTCTNMFSLYCQKSSDDEKAIYSYNPKLEKWGKNALISHDSIPVYTGLYSAFAYNNKLYCFVMHNNNDSKSVCLLKVFDPSDYSWSTVLETVPFSNAWGVKTIVIGNIIYILASFFSYNDYATNHFKNELYQFDMDLKVFVKKTIWDYTNTDSYAYQLGTINQYFFEYNGKIYVFGGESGQGYFHDIESRSIEYNIVEDKWSLLNNYGTFPARYNGFAYKIGDKDFLGMGGDEIYGLGSYIFEFSVK